MAKSPKTEKDDQPEVDPKEGDAILRRMLRTAPKQHKDMVKERRGSAGKPKRGKK
jgi:hypothetical protein